MSMSRVSSFEKAALASRLLTKEQIDQAWEALGGSGFDPAGEPSQSIGERLADQLVAAGFLNRWQAEQLLAGRTKFNLGPYWIIDSIGRGGMGQVFKAEHEILRRIIAIKVLPRSKCTPEAIANFTREIRAQARLDHPNLVRATDAGEDGNVYYLVTEYVPGTDLRKLIRNKGPMSMEAAASTISQVAAGLQHAHEQGLIHRDVKPGNILVTPDGVAKLSDLGLAGPMEGGPAADPRFGRIVGTSDYLSPDHIQAPWDPAPAWDIYSLGCTLYYAVTGKVPFPGGSTSDKINAHCKLRPLDPRRLNPALSAPFVEVLADMMAKDPAERIQTAAEVMVRLSAWVNAPARVITRPSANSVRPSVAGMSDVMVRSSPTPEDVDMEDTESSFPELPELPPGQKEGSSQISQTTHPLSAAGQETSSRLPVVGEETAESVSLLGPLAVFVGFPLALVGLILLIWFIARML